MINSRRSYGWLRSLMAGTLICLPFINASAATPVTRKATSNPEGKATALEPFLANPGLPRFVQQWERFSAAQNSIRTRLAKDGYSFVRDDWSKWESKNLATIPPELRKVFSHPCCFWLRSGERWDAVVAVKNSKDEFFLQQIKDVLKDPAYQSMVRVPFTTDEFLAAPWDQRLNKLAHPVELPFEVAWRMWDQPRGGQIYVGVFSGEPGATFYYLPDLGIAQPTEGIKGEDNGALSPDDMPDFLLIERGDLQYVKVIRSDSSSVWFSLKGRFRVADIKSWKKWQNPQRPDLRKSTRRK